MTSKLQPHGLADIVRRAFQSHPSEDDYLDAVEAAEVALSVLVSLCETWVPVLVDTTLHLEGCVLPGGHPGPCGPNERH